MITYGKNVFFTATYSRDRLLDTCWKGAGQDFNRYIQKLRRLHENKIQYLRCIEKHSDNYPHIHAILRFPVVLTITDGRYFDKTLYRSWKESWKYGHSDAQPPISKKSPLAYIIKYTTKESGHKIWKKYYQTLGVPSADLKSEGSFITRVTSSVTLVTPLQEICTKYKIKQLSWSRNFFKSLITS